MKNFQIFPCKIKKKIYQLSIEQDKLVLIGQQNQYTIELSLSLQLKWIFYGESVVGFQIDQLLVEAESINLMRLRKYLGCQVIYKGIKKFYTFEETLYQNENKQTKICKVISNQNRRVHACKCFKKRNRTFLEIEDEVHLLKSLQGLNFVPIIYEIFESNSSIYLIMEYCYKKIDDEFTDEEIKVTIYSLLRSIQHLQTLQIAHKRISRSHIMFNEENQVKLIGFRKAVCVNVISHEFELDIFKVGSLIYKFYWKKQNGSETEFLRIPDEGNNFVKKLLENQSNFSLHIDQALSHPYLQSIQGEGLTSEIQEMNPKFKGNIESKFQKTLNSISTMAKQTNFTQDLSTELQI